MKLKYAMLLVLMVHVNINCSVPSRDPLSRFSHKSVAGYLDLHRALCAQGGDSSTSDIATKKFDPSHQYTRSEHVSVELNVAAQMGDDVAAKAVLRDNPQLSARALRLAMLFGHQEYRYDICQSCNTRQLVALEVERLRVVAIIKQQLLSRQGQV